MPEEGMIQTKKISLAEFTNNQGQQHFRGARPRPPKGKSSLAATRCPLHWPQMQQYIEQ